MRVVIFFSVFFFFQAEDGIRDIGVTGVQTCALPIFHDADGRTSTLLQLKCEAAPGGPAGGSAAAHGSPITRSEERRGGEEWRSRWSPYHLKKKKKTNRYYVEYSH